VQVLHPGDNVSLMMANLSFSKEVRNLELNVNFSKFLMVEAVSDSFPQERNGPKLSESTALEIFLLLLLY
jgi:hypothetical protein